MVPIFINIFEVFWIQIASYNKIRDPKLECKLNSPLNDGGGGWSAKVLFFRSYFTL